LRLAETVFAELASISGRCRVATERATLLVAFDRHSLAERELATAVEWVRLLDDPRLVGHIDRLGAELALARGERAACSQWLEHAWPRAQRSNDLALTTGLHIVHAAWWLQESPAQGRDEAERALAMADDLGWPELALRANGVLIAALLQLQDTEAASRQLQQARSTLRTFEFGLRHEVAVETLRAQLWEQLDRRRRAEACRQRIAQLEQRLAERWPERGEPDALAS
jgi:hypothetical protein